MFRRTQVTLPTLVTFALVGCTPSPVPPAPTTLQAPPSETLSPGVPHPSQAQNSVQRPLFSPRPESITSSDQARRGLSQEGTPAAPTQLQEAVEPNCYQWSYHHTDTEDHVRSPESCAIHGNRFSIPHALHQIQTKSICVRVNGTPVFHEVLAQMGKIEIGSVPNPRSLISIRYCKKAESHPEPCPRVKDDLDGEEDSKTWDTAQITDQMSDSLKQALDQAEEEGVSEAWARQESLQSNPSLQAHQMRK